MFMYIYSVIQKALTPSQHVMKSFGTLLYNTSVTQDVYIISNICWGTCTMVNGSEAAGYDISKNCCRAMRNAKMHNYTCLFPGLQFQQHSITFQVTPRSVWTLACFFNNLYICYCISQQIYREGNVHYCVFWHRYNSPDKRQYLSIIT